MLNQASTQNNEVELELDVEDLDDVVGGIIVVCNKAAPTKPTMGDGSV